MGMDDIHISLRGRYGDFTQEEFDEGDKYNHCNESTCLTNIYNEDEAYTCAELFDDYMFCSVSCVKKYLHDVEFKLSESIQDDICDQCEKDITKGSDIYGSDELVSDVLFCSKECYEKYLDDIEIY
ncbi:MAG: hypothetical protein GX896_10710 [Clostridiales bacterium]|nr:hypothetical protein [Clostridiales bacterium]